MTDKIAELCMRCNGFSSCVDSGTLFRKDCDKLKKMMEEEKRRSEIAV
jgi:hypothetical protein